VRSQTRDTLRKLLSVTLLAAALVPVFAWVKTVTMLLSAEVDYVPVRDVLEPMASAVLLWLASREVYGDVLRSDGFWAPKPAWLIFGLLAVTSGVYSMLRGTGGMMSLSFGILLVIRNARELLTKRPS